MITKENYEIYVIDYLEGTLPDSIVKEMESLLITYPDLKETLNNLEETKLLPIEVKFSRKKRLKKEECYECVDYYAIAAAEQSLTEIDRINLGNHIYDADFKNLISIYSKIKLIADTNIRFEKKRELYRKSGYIISFHKWTTAVAAVLLFLGIGMIIYYSAKQSGSIVGTGQFSPADFFVSVPTKQHIIVSRSTAGIKSEPVKVLVLLHQPEVQQKRSRNQDYILEIIPTQQMITVYNQEIITPPDEIIQKFNISVNIVLDKNAVEWKPSGDIILPDNILTSIFHAGKNIADKIKNRDWEFLQ